MRIAVLTTSISKQAGGLFYSVRGLSDSWNEQHDTQVFTFQDTDSETDLEFWQSKVKLFKRNFSSYPFSLTYIYSVYRFKPSVIYVSSIWLFPAIAATVLSYLLDCKIIISPRGMLDQWSLEQSPKRKQALGMVYLKKLLLRVDYVHALNEPEQIAIQNYSPKSIVKIFPNGVNAPRVINEREEVKNVLFLSLF